MQFVILIECFINKLFQNKMENSQASTTTRLSKKFDFVKGLFNVLEVITSYSQGTNHILVW